MTFCERGVKLYLCPASKTECKGSRPESEGRRDDKSHEDSYRMSQCEVHETELFSGFELVGG